MKKSINDFRTMIVLINFVNDLTKTNIIIRVCGRDSIPSEFTFVFTYFEEQSNRVFATISDFFILISLEPDIIDL